MKKILVILFALAFTTETRAQEIDHKDLDAFVSTTIQKLNIAGASVLVAQKGKQLLNRGYGFADLSHDVPATPETTYFLVGPASENQEGISRPHLPKKVCLAQ